MSLSRYNFRETEAKWQRHWHERGSFAAREDSSKPKYYVLEMFPYPSGNIHMGHVRNYALGDVMARVRRMQGYNVLHPMGWDAFGLPAENAAIERGSHPAEWTMANIETMRGQLKFIGLSYDWSRELATCRPEYYRHEQLFFLKFLEKGIAYRKEAEVNWDPVDHTVLANEQVVDGRGWRSGAPVERRKLSQWFLRISDFAEELLAALPALSAWPDKVRLMQEKWIGKSQGCLMKLALGGQVPAGIAGHLDIYTTRPETLFGMSFCAVAPGHPLSAALAADNPSLAAFIAECAQLGTSEEAIEKAEKKGFNTGLTVAHPFEERVVPLYVANFVLMDYGTGAIFACPAHDQRDFEFARKYSLPVLPVIGGAADAASMAEAHVGDGLLVNSGFLNGMAVLPARERAILELEKQGLGEAKTNYRLRDWGISRQRYWGCPIPIIHCAECGTVPVPEQDLPVELPPDVSFDQPGNPLECHPTWKHVPCPACGKPAKRETDTFDTFFESSWYFARYATLPSPEPLSAEAVKRWLPVDCYIGGIEHAVLHLLYSRFFMRALKACGYDVPDEPFARLETQGMICHETYKSADGKWLSPDEVMPEGGGFVAIKTKERVTRGRVEKMSKSKKNTVDPTRIIETYGADAARLFMLSDSPPERDLEWTDAGIEGAWRYISRLWKLALQLSEPLASVKKFKLSAMADPKLLALRRATHKTIAAVTDDIERFHFNKAIARIRELTNLIGDTSADTTEALVALKEAMDAAVHLLAPFMPHLAEELWQQLGNQDTLDSRAWPKADPALLAEDEVTVAVQVNGKLKATLSLVRDMPKDQVEKAALEAVREPLKDKQVEKIIVVPNRIVNVVVK